MIQHSGAEHNWNFPAIRGLESGEQVSFSGRSVVINILDEVVFHVDVPLFGLNGADVGGDHALHAGHEIDVEHI
jgi:hypothetical protein